ncbi:NADP-dependent glyceraldehyde-3-phosphate dehydrogenase, partial [Flavobacterium sp. LBUM151]
MSLIPEEYQIKSLINQDTYLVNGELKKWTGQTTPVFSTISSTEKYAPTVLGSIPFMGEKEAAEVVEAANGAY